MMLNMYKIYKKVAGNIGQLFNFMIKGMMIPKIIHYCWYGGKKPYKTGAEVYQELGNNLSGLYGYPMG